MSLPISLPKMEVPTYELVLPSTNKKIKYRPFLVKEHKILMTLKDSNIGEISRVVRELINNCTFGKLKVDVLPHFDIEYIFLNLRARSIGEVLNLLITCNCGNEIPVEANLNHAAVIKTQDHTNKIRIGSMIIELNYPTFEQMMEIYEYSENIDKLFNIISSNLKSITKDDETYDASEYTLEEREDFLLSLSKEQFSHLERFYQTMPKIVQTIEGDCDACGTHNKVTLEGLQNFFV